MQKIKLEKLTQKLKNGERSALEELYNATHRAVFAMLLSILKDYQLSEDAMQNAYIKVYSAIDSYKDNTNPFAWIMQIAKNEALMLVRKNKEEGTPSATDGEVGYIDEGYVVVESRLTLKVLLSKLNEQEREIILLHDSAGLKHREIAQFLDKPLGSVLWSYKNAFKKLKKYIDERGDC